MAISVAIHQPNLFPRLKVLQKIASADIWVVYDDVQFVAREWQNRARLRNFTNPKNEFWLTAPVSRKCGRSTIIYDVVVIDYCLTYSKIRKCIHSSYQKSPYWNWISEYIGKVFENESGDFTSIATRSLFSCLEMLNISVKLAFSSQIDLHHDLEMNRSERLANICQAVGGDTYLTGSGGLSYLSADAFGNRGVKVCVQNWTEPNYGTESGLLRWRNFSFLDYVARRGPNALTYHLNEGVSWS